MWILLLLFPLMTWAFPVLHFIKPESNFTQIATLDSCGTFAQGTDMVGCNPALFPYQKDQGLRAGLSTITDGESVEVGQKLLFDPIKEEFLRKIFERRSFNSWGANSYIQLRTGSFYVSYDPLLVNADVFVINPASPEVAMSLIKSNRLNITSGMELANNGILKASVGAKVYYFRNEVYQDSFFISQLTNQNVKEIIKFKKQNGVAGDIGTYFQFQNAWVPKFSFILKNLNSTLNAKEVDLISENQMRPILLNEFYSRAGVGYDWHGEWGIVNTELGLPFKRAFEELYTDYMSLSLGYTLSRFTTSISYAKYQQVFGFNFGSKLASIGIFYGRSQPLGDFSTQKDNVAGIRVEVSL